MRILSVRLHNIRSYRDASFRFTEGVNGIFGNNGHGKSTVLQAIGYALYGFLNARKEDFVRKGEKSGHVIIEVEGADGALYEITRGVPSNKYEIVTPAGRKITGKEQVMDEITGSILGPRMGGGGSLDIMFKNIIGVPQGTFSAAFLMTEAARRKVFDPLLRVEEHKRAAENLRPARSDLSDTANLLDRELARMDEHISLLKGELEKKDRLGEEHRKLEEELAGSAKELEGLADRLATLEAARERTELLERELGTTSEKVEALDRDRIAALRDTARLDELKAELDRLEPDVKEYRKLDGELEELRKLQVEQGRLEKEQVALTAGRQAAVSRAGELETAIAGARDASEKALKLKGAPVEHAALVKEIPLLREELLGMKQLLSRRSESERKAAELELRIGELEKGLKGEDPTKMALEYDRIGSELNDVTSRQKRLMEQLKELANDRQRLANGICPLLGEECPRAGDAPGLFDDMVGKVKGEMKVMKAEKDRLKGELGRAKVARKALEGWREASTRIDEARGQLDTLRREIAAVKVDRDVMGALEERIADSEMKAEKLARKVSELEHLTEVANALSGLDGQKRELAEELEKLEKRLRDVSGQLGAHTGNASKRERLEQKLAELRPRSEMAQRLRGESGALAGAGERLERAVRELEAARAHLGELKKAMALIAGEFDAERYMELRRKNAKLNARSGELKGRLTAVNDRLRELERKAAEVIELGKKEADTKHRLLDVNSKIELCDFVQKVLRGSASDVAAELISMVSRQASLIFAEIMEDYNLELRWGRDYDLQLVEAGSPRSFDQLSGGEQMAASLSLRLAMLRELTGSDMVFLDEPTQNLDVTRRQNLSAQIKRVRGFSQIFVISHDDTFSAEYENVVHVHKSGGVSRILENDAPEVLPDAA